MRHLFFFCARVTNFPQSVRKVPFYQSAQHIIPISHFFNSIIALRSIMTYQNHSDDKAAADEASSLFLPAGDAKPKKTTNGVPTMRARIATCLFLLGTLGVLSSWGSSSSSNTNTHRTDGTSKALLPGHTPAVRREEYYDPRQDYCFMDTDTAGKYCWYATDASLPYGNWVKDGAHLYNDCGPECPTPPTPSPTPSPVSDPSKYDPNQDYCFKAQYVDFDQYCWYPTDEFPSGNWEGTGGRPYNDCGPECADFPKYDPSQDYCFADKENAGKYCWYTRDYTPCGGGSNSGNWNGEGGHAYNDCGPECAQVKIVDGRCFQTKYLPESA